MACAENARRVLDGLLVAPLPRDDIASS